jgi:hypothetical protein
MLVEVDSVYALSFHADYRCRHSGVCCTSDWDVPVEIPVYRSLDAAMTAGRIRPVAPAADGDPALITGDDLPEGIGAMFARTPDGACVFYHGRSGLCVVHRDGGEAQLPSTCRHFPRLAVRDARGTFVSLTHYCPTAAASLFREDVGIAIVASPPAFPPADYEGLSVDADDWAPLLHPRMLMDLDAYAAWERHMVARCAEDASPETVIATLERDARLLRAFVPGDVPLASLVDSLPREVVEVEPHESLDPSLAMHAEVMAAVPDDLKPEPDEEGLAEAFMRLVAPVWFDWATPVRRYLAAKAFANWTAYQGRGVLTIVRGLDAALALVRVEASRQCRDASRRLDADLLCTAFRQADFALNHLAVGEDLAEGWSVVEKG